MTQFAMKRGSRAQVWHNVAEMTTGGLKKHNLQMTKRGRIVSKRKSALGKKTIRNLRKLGYVAKKGSFKLFKKSMASKSKKGKRSTKKRGGATEGADLKEAFETKQ